MSSQHTVTMPFHRMQADRAGESDLEPAAVERQRELQRLYVATAGTE